MRNGPAHSHAELTALPTWRPTPSTRPQTDGRMGDATPLTSPSICERARHLPSSLPWPHPQEAFWLISSPPAQNPEWKKSYG